MSENTAFILNGAEVSAASGETIWQCADRLGIEIPHLCYRHAADYRGDGNCRTCLVEIDGERALAPSCIREPEEGMVVTSNSERAKKTRSAVFELLLADQSEPEGEFKNWLDQMAITDSRFPKSRALEADTSHTAIAVDMNKCIHCKLCVQACREIQGNDVIGMAMRGSESAIVFDMADPMGASSCVACGECVQVCPTGALKSSAPDAPEANVDADKTVDSVCPYCGVGCQVRFHVKDNKIVQVDGRNGPANHGRLCVKGRFGMDYASHDHRLTVPLIRKDSAVKTEEITVDPNDPFDQFRIATWDEALDKAADGFKDILESKGAKGLAGFGSAKGSNEEAYLFQKLIRTGFRTNNVDHCTRLCHASSVTALLEGIGSSAVTAPFISCLDSDVIVVIGANPTVNHPVAATFIKNATEAGAELIVMDPRRNALAPYASNFLQFNPGSDVAMLNALLNVIVEEKLYDRQYVEAHTEGFAELAEHVAQFTPERMSPLCGIEPEELCQVARKIAGAGAAMIFWGMGIAQHTHGTDNARCLIALALICGHVGRAGAGLHPLRGQNNVQGASDAGLIPMMYPDYKLVSDRKNQEYFEDFWGTALDPEPGLTVVEIMDSIFEGEIEGLYVMGENPAMSDPDTNHTRQALAKLKHLVVQDIFLTETANFADVILPASAWPEKDGTVTNTDRRVQIGRRALDMPGEARQDWWLIQELARRIGLDWNYGGPEDVHGEMQQCMASMRHIPWQRLEIEEAVTYPCLGEDQPGHEIIFGDGFPTTNGLGRLVPADITPPDEVPDEEFPMVLTTGRLLEHWHTGAMTRRAESLSTIEPEAAVHVSPLDMERLELDPGETVAVTTRRGTIQLAARREPNMPEGLVFIPFCFAEAPANMLTNPALDPFGKIPELKFSAARLEKTSP
ncbi:MAG: formate dehydrogenase subunit alpha [Rhodospirillaceae bacterium]|jgi:formate dehydrogenase major subunit|nr:formate dehydrogenase subunit alpha [Rhodospirillaceae bacterium]MBT3886514.1 formate dehydrogenase subunit alpha [Rhodospirillaceae bacterium]MBT4116183.1 formate dehydrogenase subunit alpha [Rhodospirillaceae bacterium]MBT4672123.1 formate dehydrogenase subunit alpha [Rhodospirillaceae bacterium]MBT5838774.1 formate dehydrogenase subunit alpha [Rhodospirillaceae bacterium]